MKCRFDQFVIALLISLSFISCEKDNKDTALQITVRDSSASLMTSASIKLYNNATDMFNNTNQVYATQQTGSDGIVLFHNLAAGQRYSFKVERGCDNNLYNDTISRHHTTGPLTENVINSVATKLLPNGALLMLVNNSPDSTAFTYNNIITKIPANRSRLQYLRQGSQLIKIYPTASPTNTRDTIVRLVCADTTMLVYPY